MLPVRRTFLSLLGAGPLLFSQPARRPNFILILTDSLGYRETGCYGSPDIPTPNIDALAKTGVRCTEGYSSGAVSNPSRAGLLTGRHQQRWGQEWDGLGHKGFLPTEEKCLPEALKELGYTTGLVGKWHLGAREAFMPTARGFNEFFGTLNDRIYIDPTKPGVHTVPVTGASTETALYRNKERVKEDDYLTDAYARESIAFVQRNREKPFFLMLSFNAPSLPLQATEKYYSRFPRIASEQRRVYAAMVCAMDEAIGLLMAQLKALGLEENTLIVFTSTSGATDAVEKTDNAPLKGYKRTLYEGGIRVPFLLRWKGTLPAGKGESRMVSALDIMPTMLGAAGVTDLPKFRFDGVNLMPYLSGRFSGNPHELLLWRMGPNGAVRRGKWKLLRGGEAVTRLYDLVADPTETRDFSGAEAATVADLKRAWDAWNQVMEPPPPPTPTPHITEYNGDRIAWHYLSRGE